MTNTEQYFINLKKEVDKIYAIAEQARTKGLDPVNKVEIPLAATMADKVVGLISVKYPQMQGSGIATRILDLEKEYGKLDAAVALVIAEEVAKQKFCKFASLLEAIDAGIRVGFAYLTIAVVASPLEGFTELKLGKRKDNGKEYFVAYFSGPIRSAGTTASCMALILIDYLRELFGYATYDPTEEEVKRYVAENHDYHERVNNLQYFPLDEEMTFLARNLPFQISGEPTEKLEVSNYKNLERVETNYIRGGMCLIFSEGLAQKAAKAFRLYNGAKAKGLKMTGFDFIEAYIELHKKLTSGEKKGGGDSVPVYIKDLVAGRPVFGHPSRSGGFRFRYGRSRVDGFSATSLHPATMAITDDFIAIGTQLKIEKPTKGCVVASCDSIDGPIVKLVNGSVRKLKTQEEAKKIYRDVEEIIYLGDILFPFSDLANRNSNLIPPGYVQEWWKLDLREKDAEVEKRINCFKVSFEEAISLSSKFGIPLHPDYIFYWTQISKEQFLGLINWLKHSIVRSGKLVFPFNKTEQERFQIGKRALELLGIEHTVTIENVVLDSLSSKSLFANLGLNLSLLDAEECFLNELIDEGKFNSEKSVLEIVNSFSGIIIKDKAGEFIGTRMGRPEKAKLRKLQGSPNVLFSVGKEGGRLRSVQTACEAGKVKGSFPLFYCEKCDKETIYPLCERCNQKTKKKYYFAESGEKHFVKFKDGVEKEGTPYSTYDLDINYYFGNAVEKIGMDDHEVPLLIKGVRGTSSANKSLEHLSKGILRAKYDLQVNKDGTIRFDATELPVVAFKPKEISVSVEKLKELGYDKDVDGNELVNEDQIIEIMPHDVLLPCCTDSPDEKADDVFIRVSEFVDEELEEFYGLDSFYNVKTKEDLIGKLGVCMAPHNCAGVVCRFIGFSNTQGIMASPYMHAAIRRDCFDYDTYIPIRENGNWKICKIGELVEKLNPDKVIDDYGTKEKKVEGFETLGVLDSVKNFKLNNFTKHTKQPMFEIKTSLGKKIRVTENHKFLVNNGMKRAGNLKIGDKLPLPIKINIPSRKLGSINLLESLKEESIMVRGVNKILLKMDKTDKECLLNHLKITKKQFMNYKLRDSYPAKFILALNNELKGEIFEKAKIAIKRDNVNVPIIINLEQDLLEVIGLYIAEGYSRSLSGKKGLNQVYIASNDKNIRNLVKGVIKKYFGLNPSEKKSDRVTFSSKIFYLFFNKILGCGNDSRAKRIPSIFLDLELNNLAAVLRGYFEGDGSVSLSDRRVTCDSVSEGLLNDLEFCLNRFGIFAKRYEYEKEPGNIVKQFYLKKGRDIPKFKITKLIIGSDFVENFKQINFISKRKKTILNFHNGNNFYGMRIDRDEKFIYDPIISIESIGERESYCLNINTRNHLVVVNSIVTKNCDGDEAALMLLGDVLLNFSREFLPGHRGGTQDAPLVLNTNIDAGEVDDQILDFEFVREYPIELYRLAELKKHSSEVKNVLTCKKILKEGKNPFVGLGFTHDTDNFNNGVRCSSYKLLATMQDKVKHQMELVERIRAVDTSDIARLIIERHFIRDMRGNLRKFSMQGFRCVSCNEILRRPPLSGVCPRCKGKIIFTIHEGGIKKYLEPALSLAEKYNLSAYIKQSLQLTKEYIDSVFGKELEKQEGLDKWF